MAPDALAATARRIVPEEMDRAELPEAELRRALVGLRRLAGPFSPSGFVWSLVRDLAPPPRRPLRLLDVATGSGDFPRDLVRRARADRIPLSVLAIDRNPRCIEIARELSAGEPEIRFEPGDALQDPFPQEVDVITARLFLHHLDDGEAVRFLRRANEARVRLGVVIDLVRGPAASIAIGAAARVVTRSRIVHADSVRSVRAAFRARDLLALAREAGLSRPRVWRRFPFWWVLAWEGGA